MGSLPDFSRLMRGTDRRSIQVSRRDRLLWSVAQTGMLGIAMNTSVLQCSNFVISASSDWQPVKLAEGCCVVYFSSTKTVGG